MPSVVPVVVGTAGAGFCCAGGWMLLEHCELAGRATTALSRRSLNSRGVRQSLNLTDRPRRGVCAQAAGRRETT